MGVFDKIKNALFEVEYVEVEEQPKKEKKEKPKKDEEDNSSEKPIAKKIVLPGKKDEKIKKIQEEELVDQDFETRPKDETIKEEDKASFKFMDDADFKVDDEEFIKDPIGMTGKKLGSRSIVITTPKKNIVSVVSLLENIGVEVVDISIGCIGDMYAFRNKDLDTKVGAIVNIGSETTEISLYNKGIAVKSSITGYIILILLLQ